MPSKSTSMPGGAHPLVPNEDRRKKRPWWLLLLAAIIVLAILALALRSCSGSNTKDAVGSAAGSATSPGTGGSSETASATASGTDSASAAATSPSTVSTDHASGTPGNSSSAAAPGTGDANGGTLTSNSTALLPAPAEANTDLATYVGQQAVAKGVLVLSAPANNGFWIGTSTEDEVWVQLLLPGLVSPHPVRKGDHVSFPGMVVANSANFAQEADVTAADGAARLTAQKAHLQVAKTAIRFTD